MLNRILVCVSVLTIYTSLPTLAGAQSFRAQVEPTVKAVRAQYPPLVTPEQVGEMLNAIAWQHRGTLKLLKKGGGGNCPSPQGVRISCDIIIWAPAGTPDAQTFHIDIFSGASGDGGLVPASAMWKSAGACTKRPDSGCEMKNALEPISPGVIEPPNPPTDPVPPPAPSSTDLSAVLEQLAELRLRLTAVDGRFDIYTLRDVMNTLSEIALKQTDTQRQIDQIEEQIRTMTFPCFTATSRVLGTVDLCPKP